MTNQAKRPAPWSAEENTAIVALYFQMLDAATSGHPYSKAEMIRQARGQGRGTIDALPSPAYPLAARSKGSIEAKLMNCSAAHRDLGTPIELTMDGHGYRALSNYQATLKDAMQAELICRDREFHGRVQTGDWGAA